MDVRFEQRVNIKFCVKLGKTATSPYSPDLSPCDFFLFPRLKKMLKGRRHDNIEVKRLRRWSSRAFRKRHSPGAFRTCRNADNSVLTAEGTTSKGTGSISCEVEFCIFLQNQSQNFTDKGLYENYHYPMCKNPEERSSHLLRGGSLKYSICKSFRV
jgi:hypothetical protein